MVQCSLVTASSGHFVADLQVNSDLYKSFEFSALSNLCSDIILGRNFMKLHQGVEFAYKGSKPKQPIQSDLHGPDPSVTLSDLPPDCKTVVTSLSHHSISNEAFIIEKSKSPWRAQILVTSDEWHKRRMVTEYSRTINKYTPLDAYPVPRIHDLFHDIAKYKVFSQLALKSVYYQVILKEEKKKKNNLLVLMWMGNFFTTTEFHLA